MGVRVDLYEGVGVDLYVGIGVRLHSVEVVGSGDKSKILREIYNMIRGYLVNGWSTICHWIRVT